MLKSSGPTVRRAVAVLAGLLALTCGLPASVGAVASILPGQSGLRNLDARTGRVAATAAQKVTRSCSASASGTSARATTG